MEKNKNWLHTQKKSHKEDLCPVCQEDLYISSTYSKRIGLVDENDTLLGWLCYYCRSEFDDKDRIVTIEDSDFGSLEIDAEA
tara:strand:- start:1355 stop:1600 length:246 start_codon:yes stop_codon:yes gene_type:complete